LGPNHFRIVFAARKDDLEMAIGGFATFLKDYRQ